MKSLDSSVQPKLIINASALKALLYCPRQYYLQEVEGTHPPNADIYSGRRLHTQLEREGGEDWQQYVLKNAYKELKGYGEPVQYSIFRVRLNQRDREQLRWKLEQTLASEDSLLIVGLCNRCVERITACNRPETWDSNPSLHLIC